MPDPHYCLLRRLARYYPICFMVYRPPDDLTDDFLSDCFRFVQYIIEFCLDVYVMIIFWIFLAVIVVVLVFGPGWWVKRVMDRHSRRRDDFPGTGGELATHLAARFGLPISVERTEFIDHYDPTKRTIFLRGDHMDVPSLTGIAIAAHEIGHAIQHTNNEAGLRWRTRLVRVSSVTDIIGRGFFVLSPFFGFLSPRFLFIFALIGFCFLLLRVLVHLITLPVEYDASFSKALPILEAGDYLGVEDLRSARLVLRAAALTYVSSALTELINMVRWLRRLR